MNMFIIFVDTFRCHQAWLAEKWNKWRCERKNIGLDEKCALIAAVIHNSSGVTRQKSRPTKPPVRGDGDSSLVPPESLGDQCPVSRGRRNGFCLAGGMIQIVANDQIRVSFNQIWLGSRGFDMEVSWNVASPLWMVCNGRSY